MTTREQTSSRFDLRALPIVVKIAIGMSAILLLSAVILSQLMQQLVYNSQNDIALSDLETASYSQALRMVDLLGQEIVALSRLGTSSIIQQELIELWEEDTIVVEELEDAIEPDPQLTLQIRAFRETNGELSSVVLLNPDGVILASSPSLTSTNPSEPGSWEWFQEFSNHPLGPQTQLYNPFDDGLYGDSQGIHIIVPVFDERAPGQERLIGVIYGVWNMKNTLDIIDLGNSRQGMVLQSEGTVLISPINLLGERMSSEVIQQIRAESRVHEEDGTREHVERTGGSFIFDDEQNEQWLYGFTQFEDLGLADDTVAGLDWTILVRQPASTVIERADLLLNRLYLALGVSAAVLTTTILIMARYLLQPLRELTEATYKLQEGDLSTEIPTFPPDEVGQLSNVLHTLVEQLLFRVRQLRSAVLVSQAASVTLDIRQMLNDVVDGMARRFGYPEVQIYLTETGGRFMRLNAASGTESERLLSLGHRQPIDETTLEGRAILLNDIQIGGTSSSLMLKMGQAVDRSKVAFPLQTSSGVIGALYLSAGRRNIFTQEDIDIINLVVDQISGAIENARLFEQSAANLAEIEALNRQLTREAWIEFIGEDEALRHTSDPEQRWPDVSYPVQAQAVVQAEVFIDPDGRSVLAAPLILRGETIGTLSVARAPGASWSQDEITLLESVASRMIVIVEGLRLVEESALTAQREHTVNDISATLLQRAASVDSVLQSALDQFSRALSSDHLSLRIGTPPVEGDRQITSGNADSSDNGADTDGS